jgi:hypothetical protein
MEAYCVKCWGKKEIKDPRRITLKNGRTATLGTCNTCGARLFRIGWVPAISPLASRVTR